MAAHKDGEDMPDVHVRMDGRMDQQHQSQSTDMV